MKIAFFGTSEFSTIVLDTLLSQGITPDLIITSPDKPQGRNLVLTPSPVKLWAQKYSITHITPATLKTDDVFNELSLGKFDLFIVASYGLIIPKRIIELPIFKTLNIHPSLLPKFRGPSPLHSTILADEQKTGVTIIQLDEFVDHGPIVAQKEIFVTEWPASFSYLQKLLAEEGACLLAEILPQWETQQIQPHTQNDSEATFTKKITKQDGLISLSAPSRENFLKIQAFQEWPGTHFFAKRSGKEIRVIIKKARLENGELVIDRVVPEGKKEMDFQDFLRTAQIE